MKESLERGGLAVGPAHAAAGRTIQLLELAGQHAELAIDPVEVVLGRDLERAEHPLDGVVDLRGRLAAQGLGSLDQGVLAQLGLEALHLLAGLLLDVAPPVGELLLEAPAPRLQLLLDPAKLAVEGAEHRRHAVHAFVHEIGLFHLASPWWPGDRVNPGADPIGTAPNLTRRVMASRHPRLRR